MKQKSLFSFQKIFFAASHPADDNDTSVTNCEVSAPPCEIWKSFVQCLQDITMIKHGGRSDLYPAFYFRFYSVVHDGTLCTDLPTPLLKASKGPPGMQDLNVGSNKLPKTWNMKRMMVPKISFSSKTRKN